MIRTTSKTSDDPPLDGAAPHTGDASASAAPVPVPASVLAIRLSSLGDVLMTFPALDAMRAAWPSARLIMLTDERYASMLRGCPAVDELWTINRRALARLRPSAVANAVALLARLARTRFDCVVDFHAIFETGLLARLAGGPLRVAPLGRAANFWYTHRTANMPFPAMRRRHVDMLRDIGLIPAEAPVPPLRLVPDSSACAEADRWLAGTPLNAGSGPLLGVFPGASRDDKRWPVERFAEMIVEANRSGLVSGTVVFGGPAEAGLLESLQQLVVHDAGVDRFWCTPSLAPQALVALVQRLPLLVFVSSDTGPMHLAVAARSCRVISLFVSPNPHFEPPAPHRILWSPGGRLDQLSVRDVLDAVQAVADTAVEAEPAPTRLDRQSADPATAGRPGSR